MKKISILLALLAAFALTFVTTGCKNGEDGDDGLSATDLVLNETGNKWYKYGKEAEGENSKVTTDSSIDLGDIYIKYDTSENKLVVAAVGDEYYGLTSKELSRGKWAASAVYLRIAGKISSVDSDPTSGKDLVTDISSWGDFTAEKLIKKLFEN